MLEETTDGKSLTVNKNKRGHNNVPCGTPETTSIRLDCLPSTTTLCFLFLENYKSIAKLSHLCRSA